MRRRTIIILTVNAIVIALVLIALFINGVSDKQYEVKLGDEIPGSGGFCLSGISSKADGFVYSVDVSPCDAKRVVFESSPMFLQKDPLPEGMKRGYSLRRSILSVMPESPDLTLREANSTTKTAVIVVQKIHSKS